MAPSATRIGRGLTAATERFAAELAAPSRSAPDWSDFGWRMAQAAAVLHGVTPLLAGTLRWTGPESWQAFAQEQHHHTLLRYHRIASALDAIDDRAKTHDLPVVALKGAALHALGVYRPGERPMSDIDLLVREADAQRAAQLLIRLGYAHTGSIWKHELFEEVRARAATPPLGEHVSYPIKIDLHTRIVEKLPLTPIAITDQVFPRDPVAGLNAYPSTRGLLLHLLLHAAGNLCGRQLRLMHLHDLVRLAARVSATDWHELPWWALPPLELLNRYHPAVVPAEVLAGLRVACPWPLRRLYRHADLSRMSYAALSIPAFPGLAWCRSNGERLRYVRNRLVPNAEQRVSRRLLATEQWATPSSWTHLSQTRRVLTWLISRPPRQASLYIVRAALGQPLA